MKPLIAKKYPSPRLREQHEERVAMNEADGLARIEEARRQKKQVWGKFQGDAWPADMRFEDAETMDGTGFVRHDRPVSWMGTRSIMGGSFR
jgi:hypothetical protein